MHPIYTPLALTFRILDYNRMKDRMISSEQWKARYPSDPSQMSCWSDYVFCRSGELKLKITNQDFEILESSTFMRSDSQLRAMYG